MGRAEGRVESGRHPTVAPVPGRSGFLSFVHRLWVYQRERFPLIAHGLSTAVFMGAAAACGANIAGPGPAAAMSAVPAAGLVLFCQFFLLRVADEFKDAAIDARFRPERPVPRGLVTLDELRRLGVGAAVLQVLCVSAIDVQLLPLLGAIWLWFALMSVEFFAGDWLRRRPALYMASHMMIMPLLALFAMAAAAPEGPNRLPAVLSSAGVQVFCALSLAGGVLLETGRKIRTREQERPGVETYTALWGAPLAVGVWLAAACTAAILALWMAALLGTPWPTCVVAGAGLAAASVLAVLRLKRPRPALSFAFEMFSGLWVMALMFILALTGQQGSPL